MAMQQHSYYDAFQAQQAQYQLQQANWLSALGAQAIIDPRQALDSRPPTIEPEVFGAINVGEYRIDVPYDEWCQRKELQVKLRHEIAIWKVSFFIAIVAEIVRQFIH